MGEGGGVEVDLVAHAVELGVDLDVLCELDCVAIRQSIIYGICGSSDMRSLLVVIHTGISGFTTEGHQGVLVQRAGLVI